MYVLLPDGDGFVDGGFARRGSVFGGGSAVSAGSLGKSTAR